MTARSTVRGFSLQSTRRSAGLLHWLALLLALLSVQASAHAFLLDTFPRAGARRPVAPSEVVLNFSEPVGLNSERVRLRTLNGKALTISTPERRAGGREVTAALPALKQGVYIVTWEALASDGHLSVGEFAFGVGEVAGVPSESGSNARSVPAGATIASALLFLGLSLALGGWLSERFIWREVSCAPRAWVRAGLLLAILGAALQVALLLIGAQAGWSLASALRVVSVPSGQLAIVSLTLLSVTFLLRRAWMIVPLAFAVITAGLSGHALQLGPWMALLSVTHFVAGAVWIGALTHLVRAVTASRSIMAREEVPGVVRRYASFAGWTLLPLLLAGALLAVPQFTHPSEVLGSAYGRILLLKLTVVLVVLLLALIARLRTLPLSASRMTLFRILTGSEAALLVMVVVLSASLVNTSPPQSLASAYALGAAPLEGPVVRLGAQAGFLTVFVAAAEGQLQVQVVEPTGNGTPAQEARLSIGGVQPNGKGLTFIPSECGRGCFTVKYDWPAGITRLSLNVTHPTWAGGRADVQLPWPPSPEASAQLVRVVQAMRKAGTFNVHEESRSGPSIRRYTYPISAQDFLALEAYTGGGLDVRELPSNDATLKRLTVFIPGSNVWYELWAGEDHRLRRERLVAPGNAFTRTFRYADER